jgi:hypothetical protein
MLTETPPRPTRKGSFYSFTHKISKYSNSPIIRQNIYCLYLGAVYMVQLQTNPGVPKLAQFWRDPAFVVISY